MEEKQLAFECRSLKTAGQSASVAPVSIFKPTCWETEEKFGGKVSFWQQNCQIWWWTGRHADSNDDESLVKITPAQMQPGRLERPTHGNSDKKKKNRTNNNL